MKTLAPALLPILALSAFGGAQSRGIAASADSIIQRCESGDGNAVYTDKPCTMFQAQPTHLSEDLAFRLALAAAESRNAPEAAMGEYADAGTSLQPVAPGRRSTAAGCARSPEQLSRDLVGAFALHDVNRVAESYHWAGMSQRQALPVMKQLERLSAQPLADARFLAAWIGPGSDVSRALPRDAGLMQLVFADRGGRIVDFEVRRYAGCYFIAA